MQDSDFSEQKRHTASLVIIPEITVCNLDMVEWDRLRHWGHRHRMPPSSIDVAIGNYSVALMLTLKMA